MRRLRRARGFTLLEVLVALMVIAVGLAAVIRAGSSNSANAIYLRDKTLATYVAANKAAELRLAGDWPAPGTRRGRMQMGYHEWHWTVRISETFDAGIRRADIEAGSDATASQASLSLFLPEPSIP